MINGHSHAVTGQALTKAQVSASQPNTIPVHTRMGGATSLALGASGMYTEESGFTDLFNAAAAVNNEETLLMGMKSPLLDSFYTGDDLIRHLTVAAFHIKLHHLLFHLSDHSPTFTIKTSAII